MSLINDALKRAQQVQTPQLPTGPMLRPAEPEDIQVKRSGLLLPIGLALIALAILFLVWRIAQTGEVGTSATVKEVWAATEQTSKPSQPGSTAAVSGPAPAVETSQAAPPATRIAATPAPVTTAPATAALAPAPLSAPAELSQAPEASAGKEPVPTAQPAAQPLKLQSIVLSARPSAMISGTIVSPGDALGAYRVKSITNGRVELASDSRTIVLTLR